MIANPIYTPLTLYNGFSADLPLRDSIVSDERVEDVVYNEVYFNGRETSEGRVLIYGILARHSDGKKHSAILIIPDYEDKTDIQLMNIYVRLGYDVLLIDYKGETETSDNYTNYPSDIKYANLKYSEFHLDKVLKTARETCRYEWTCVASYAVSFLKARLETNKIGVLGVKYGAEIMWHLVSMDNRITCAVALFGAGWRAYKGIDKFSSLRMGEIDEERIRYIAGVDSHSFAPYCKCPVALLTSTNSAEFDADRAHDTIRRVNPKEDTLFCLSPRMKDALDINCTRNSELFFGAFLSGQRIVRPSEPQLSFKSIPGGVRVEASVGNEVKTRNVRIYLCENQTISSWRNWVLLNASYENDKYVAEYTCVNGGGIVFAFVVAEYRNGITVSTGIIPYKCPVSDIIRTNLIYSNAEGIGDFVCDTDPKDMIANVLYYKNSPLVVKRGPTNISGVSSKSGLISYKPNEKCVQVKADSIFKLDVYCNSPVTLCATIGVSIGKDNEQTYTCSVDVPEGEVWQNVVLNLKDFKSRDGKLITDYDEVVYIGFKSDGLFAVNNVLFL
ncbi:MAG: hypothetical protein SOV55_06285 [Candidatus Borkfalkiaceae bacterium]|nr:hypothetical protein [bacterium]MDY2851710.1 hypothetical protein [Christensenellaceae bacterium]